jgi:hypothetical protein
MIQRHFGVTYHAHSLSARLRDLGWSVQVPAVRARERDEELIRTWLDRDWPRLKKNILDVDGTLVATGAGCKQGIDIAYDGTWGSHPLIISLANTGEVISLVNRPGNRPSHEGAAEQLDLAILLGRGAGFRRILLRGDTDFTQAKQLDAWDAEGVTFLFGIDAMPNLKALAEDLPASSSSPLRRPPQYTARGKPRRRPERVKDRIVRERGYETLTRIAEDVPWSPIDRRPATGRTA